MNIKVPLFIKHIGILFKEAFLGFIDHNCLKLSAALSYYTIFSLPPLLIIIISLSGVFFGADAVRGEIFGQINSIVGNNNALQIQEAIKEVTLSNHSTFLTIVGIVILLIGASGVFAEIQESLNLIWGLKAKPKRGFIKFIYNRLMSFSMIGAMGFLLMVGLIINSVIDVLNNSLVAQFPQHSIVLIYIGNLVLVFLITTLLFSVIFRTLPDGKINHRDTLVGASFTSFLFMVGKFAIGYYLGRSSIASLYGAAGSVIILLAWVYYSSIILYFGAEFTKVYAKYRGHNIVPNSYVTSINEA